MPVASPQKTINVSSIDCGGVATVTIGFKTAASLALNPSDIVLIMDRSSAMTDVKMSLAKEAACQFIDMIDGARSGSVRVGLVSFADTAQENVKLQDEFSTLKPAVNALEISNTAANHKAAWETVGNLWNKPKSQNEVAVMFTGSNPTEVIECDKAVQALKEKGVEIFCIGIDTDENILNTWATDPDRTHVASVDNAEFLYDAFRKIGEEVVQAGVRDGVIEEKLTPNFKIVKIHEPETGTVEVTSPQSLTWSIGAAGIKEQPTLTSLSFDIMHIGKASGLLPVNQSVVYSDREGNTLNFESPSVKVKCSGTDIYPEPCPSPVEIEIPGCEDAKHAEISNISLQSLGRIVQMDLTIKNICPGKQVAASVMLSEAAPDGTEQPRGIKHILIPAHSAETCEDITLKCVQFSLPEALDLNGSPDSICNSRKFNARVIANYVDTDFICCSGADKIL